MKRILIVFVVLFHQILGFSQNCIPLAVVFTSQSQIDSFPINYPSCTIISGSLGIVGQNITNLDSLYQISEIHGSLQLLDAPNLNSLVGFDKLRVIKGLFKIDKCGIDNFIGLDSLRNIGGGFFVTQNDSLKNCIGLANLNTIGGNFDISICGSFVNYDGLYELDSVAGDFIVNPNVLNCVGLNSLKCIGGSFGLSGYINSLVGLDSMELIKGELSVSNTYLQNFQGLNRLAFLNGGFEVFQNDSLKNFLGLDSLHSIDGLRISLNPGLNSLTGLNSVDSIFNFFQIENNSQTIDISAMSGLNEFNGELTFRGNVVGLHIFDNLDSLDYLSIDNNSTITEFSYFDSLKYVYGLNISDNPNLVSISGLQNLQKTGTLSIKNNQFLVSIEGLNHPIEIVNYPNINNNIILSTCSIEPICSLVWQTPDFYGFYGNYTGCNSIEEISASCGTAPDLDGDGINDFLDNCPNTQNTNQVDCNNNGIGDACEQLDSDCDGVFDSTDNCPNHPNPFQTDLNNNGIGDACEEFPKIGFNTLNPKSEFHISNGSIFIDNPEKGVILKNQQGQCYTFKANDNNLQVVYIPCPQ